MNQKAGDKRDEQESKRAEAGASGRGWFVEVGFWAFALPALGYAMVYAFKYGQAAQWGYPKGLISLDPSDLAFAGAVALVVATIMVGIALLLSSTKSERWQIVILFVLVMLFALGSLLMQLMPSEVAAALIALSVLVAAMLLVWRSARIWVLRAWGIGSKSGGYETTPSGGGEPLTEHAFLAITLLVLAGSLAAWSYSLGVARAEQQTVYYEYKGSTGSDDWLVLDASNSRLVLGQVQTRSLTRHYRVVGTQDAEASLAATVAGPLSSPPQ